MATLVLHRHPAVVYYFLMHHFIERGLTPDLTVEGAMVSRRNESDIALKLTNKIVFTLDGDLESDIVFESQDEELLVWLSLALPRKWDSETNQPFCEN